MVHVCVITSEEHCEGLQRLGELLKEFGVWNEGKK